MIFKEIFTNRMFHDQMNKKQVFLSIVSKSFYNDAINETLKNLKNKKVCYVTLNKTYSSLKKNLALIKGAPKKIFYIDAVSAKLSEKKEADDVVYVSSPAALTELSIAITEAIRSEAFDVIVFDSLSTLNIYESGNSNERFVSYLTGRLKTKTITGILTCLEEDIDCQLVKNSFMYVDNSFSLSKFFQAKNNLSSSSKKKLIKKRKNN